MGCVYRRHQTLWIKFKGVDGKWVYRRTDYRVGQEDLAKKLLKRVEERLEAGSVDEHGPMTVARYAKKWVEDCRELGIEEWKNNEARLTHHVLPELGDKPIDAVRARHIAELFKKLRNKVGRTGKLAPKTIRNIYSAVQGMFKEAAVAGLVDASPCFLTEHHLGPIEDKDTGWRATAVYDREELALLLSSPLVPADRRVVYALEGLGALRHGEAAGLRWFHWEPELEPLGKLTVATSYDKGRTKTRRNRWMPVHPVLAEILTDWRDYGWAELMGRQPQSSDLIVPCGKRPRLKEVGVMRDKNYSRKRFLEDLAALAMRHRRGHDLRRTMISLARSDGARKDLLEVCTHTPGRGQTAIDVYTTFEWEALCKEVWKLRMPWDGAPTVAAEDR